MTAKIDYRKIARRLVEVRLDIDRVIDELQHQEGISRQVAAARVRRATPIAGANLVPELDYRIARDTIAELTGRVEGLRRAHAECITVAELGDALQEHGYRTKAGLLARVEGLLRHATRGWSKCPAECCDGLGTRIGT